MNSRSPGQAALVLANQACVMRVRLPPHGTLNLNSTFEGKIKTILLASLKKE
jgi:hypothetical protein